MEIKTTALIGLGALGILFGRRMPGVQVIADEARAQRYRAEGPVLCNGEACSFAYVSPAEGKPVDLILVAVKAPVLPQAVADLKRFVGENTIILSLLNGITSEDVIEAAYPGHTVWSVAIGMDATRAGRTLNYKNPGQIQFGERDGSVTPRVQAVEAYLTACGIEHTLCEDILYKQWMKLMINDGLNQAAAAFDLTYGGLRESPEAYAAMCEAMRETIAVANAEGIALPADAGDRWVEASMPGFAWAGMPSMRQDVLAKRPTEVAEFAGVICALGQKHGIPTPVNDFFRERIRQIEAGYGQG